MAEYLKNRIWKYAKNLDAMIPFDKLFCTLTEKSKFFVFTIMAQDLLFFSSNSLLHQDITVKQSTNALISYMAVLFVLSMIIWDILKIFHILKNFRKEEKNGEKGKSKTGVDEGIEDERRKRGVIVFEVEKKREEELKLKNGEERFKSVIEFSRDGIKYQELNSNYGKFYNFFFFVRILFFEPVFISLQMLPLVQVLLIFMIQMAFLIYSIKAIFFKKIFKSWLVSLNYGINEIFLTMFMVLCLLITLGIENWVKYQTWLRIQRVTIIIIMIISGINMAIFVINMLGTISMIFKKKEQEKAEENNKLNQVRPRVVSTPVMSNNMEDRSDFSRIGDLKTNSKRKRVIEEGGYEKEDLGKKKNKVRERLNDSKEWDIGGNDEIFEEGLPKIKVYF